MGDEENDIISPDGHYRWNGEEWELIDVVKTLDEIDKIPKEPSESLNEEFQNNEQNQETETITDESISLNESESSPGFLGDIYRKLLSKDKTAMKFILLNWWGLLVLIMIVFDVISIAEFFRRDSLVYFEENYYLFDNEYFQYWVNLTLCIYVICFYLNIISIREDSETSKINFIFTLVGNILLIFSGLYAYNNIIGDFRITIGIHLLLLTGIYSLVYNLIFWKHTKENPNI